MDNRTTARGLHYCCCQDVVLHTVSSHLQARLLSSVDKQAGATGERVVVRDPASTAKAQPVEGASFKEAPTARARAREPGQTAALCCLGLPGCVRERESHFLNITHNTLHTTHYINSPQSPYNKHLLITALLYPTSTLQQLSQWTPSSR